jgi:hypothetical protein
LLGRIKDYLHYCQIDQDLGTLEQVQQLYKEEAERWEAMDRRLLEVYLEELPRLQWPPY